ncbi:sce7726 family protein [Desulfofundulus thermocisternus]|uniref:sce7726 family protein n=1 Tax=Desulfofundulus thermocisternus TaxID=42471 RepID=UPI00217E5EE3|nr:sce7726 family protein [Desulfofundulus thermocisternus]MCS5697252.1 sce7726 family protein [Desulfofundulus thermocisternus]
MTVCDKDIRSILYNEYFQDFRNDPDTVIVDELELCLGEARIDIAVINGAIHGYEIKSERDTLKRLLAQRDVYNKVFDTVTIITSKNHIDKVLEIVPSWWGVIQVEKKSGKNFGLNFIRQAMPNKDVDPFALVQLLWRNEALNLLKKYGLQKGYLSKPRSEIWAKLAASLSLDKLRYEVREAIKGRKKWRDGRQ